MGSAQADEENLNGETPPQSPLAALVTNTRASLQSKRVSLQSFSKSTAAAVSAVITADVGDGEDRKHSLIIMDEDGNKPKLVPVESTHEYMIRPCTPWILAWIAAPLLICSQLLIFCTVFVTMFKQCDDIAYRQRDVLIGIPLAIAFVAAEETSNLFFALKILHAAKHLPTRRFYWARSWAVIMILQGCFEVIVYALVMSSSKELVDLIKDFIALAVTNQVRPR
jgi:hypothetical protein